MQHGNLALSLTDMPHDALLEIMRRLAASSYSDFVSAKSTCKLLRDTGDTPSVRRVLAVDQIPPFEDDEDEVLEAVINVCAVDGNVKAIFRLAFEHSFCHGGDYQYGYQLLKLCAYERLDMAIYLRSLVAISHCDE